MLENLSSLGVSGADIFRNTRIKSYPDGSTEILVCDHPVFGGEGWEDQKKKPRPKAQQKQEGVSDRAIRRARAQLRDLALCTPFRYFVTLTLDSAKVDRYDMSDITRRLNHWCDNQVRRKGLAYVLVPERHKDGAVHFHGFFNDALEAVDSGTMTAPGWKKPRRPRSAAQRALWAAQGAQPVYNLPAWSLGFTTAIELYGEYPRAVSYVCKYIGKGREKIGGRWYYSGGALGRPQVSYSDSNIRDVEQAPGAYSFTVPGLCFVCVTVKGGDTFDADSADSGPGGTVPLGTVLLGGQAPGV